MGKYWVTKMREGWRHICAGVGLVGAWVVRFECREEGFDWVGVRVWSVASC